MSGGVILQECFTFSITVITLTLLSQFKNELRHRQEGGSAKETCQKEEIFFLKKTFKDYFNTQYSRQ